MIYIIIINLIKLRGLLIDINKKVSNKFGCI